MVQSMRKHTINAAQEILILEPSGPLEAADFEAVIHDVIPISPSMIHLTE